MKDKRVLYQKMCEELDGKTNLGVNFDTVKRSFLYGGSLPCSYYYISGFGNTEMIERFMSYMLQNREGATRLREDPKGFLETVLPYTAYSMSANVDDVLYSLYSGNSVIVFEGLAEYVVADTRKYPARGIEEPAKDKVLRGSREGFVEALLTNSALIRRRIRDPRLIFKQMTVGESSSTDLLICYMDHLADHEYLAELIGKIEGISVDALNLGQESLTELLIDNKWYNPFPKVRFTERPDAAAAMLMEGSVILLCDNDASAMILPTSIFDFLQDTDDFYFLPLIGGYMKTVRNLVFLSSLLLTPVWYTLQQMPQLLPQSFDFLLYEGKSFLPLLFQLLLFELAVDGLKLASLNTPDTLSNSLSVISALILGDLAINVGWLSEQILLYMAFVAIASFTQPSYELGYAFKFMRIITLVLISMFSFVGLFLGIGLTVLLIVTNSSFSGKRGYLYPLYPFNGRALLRIVLRVRLKGKNCLQKRN
jgi:stage V sporulation protein AF